MISDYSLEKLLPISLRSAPAVSIRKENKIWEASAMLVHYLESFTDSLVVTDEQEKPIGVLGGFDVIKGISEQPNNDFFEKKTVADIMDSELVKVTPDTKLSQLLDKWKTTRRAFSIIPNFYQGFSSISAKKILEIGANCKTDLTVSDLPKKQTITFEKDDTIGQIIKLMFENKTRKLVLKDSQEFISDRIIIQTIAKDLNYLKNEENFLEKNFSESFKLEQVKNIEKDFNLAELAKLMLGMTNPYVMVDDQVYSPWDICLALESKKISIEYY